MKRHLGFGGRPGGNYRWRRCCSTPDNKHCNVLQAASLRCQAAAGSRAGACFQEKHPPFPGKEKENGSKLCSSISCRGPAGGSHPAGSHRLLRPPAPWHSRAGAVEEDAEEREMLARGCNSGWGPSWHEPEPAGEASGASAAVEHQVQGGSAEQPQQRTPSSSWGIRRWHQPGPLPPLHRSALQVVSVRAPVLLASAPGRRRSCELPGAGLAGAPKSWLLAPAPCTPAKSGAAEDRHRSRDPKANSNTAS